MNNNAEEVSRTGAGLDLEAIEARYKASTSGDWRRELSPDGQHAEPDIYSGEQEIAWTFYYKDGEFIAHSHQDIPALLEEVRRLRAENDALSKRVAELEGMVTHIEASSAYQIGAAVIQGKHKQDKALEKLRAAIEAAQQGQKGE